MTEKRMFSVALITTGGVNEDMLAQVAKSLFLQIRRVE